MFLNVRAKISYMSKAKCGKRDRLKPLSLSLDARAGTVGVPASRSEEGEGGRAGGTEEAPRFVNPIVPNGSVLI